MTCVADLYDAEVTHITGAPELDVYGPRDAACYVGAINALDQGLSPAGRRVRPGGCLPT
jgi:hypothetical protein